MKGENYRDLVSVVAVERHSLLRYKWCEDGQVKKRNVVGVGGFSVEMCNKACDILIHA
jgi:hypothetical protein